MQLSNEFENAMASLYMPNSGDAIEAVPIFVHPNFLRKWQEILAEADRTSPDMRIPNPDDPWEEDIVQVPPSAAALQQSFAEVHEKAAQALAKQHAGKSSQEIRRLFPDKLGERIVAIAQRQASTPRQAFIKRDLAIRTANAEFGKALRAAGVKSHQHTVNDFIHVISTQLGQWALGNAPSVSELLRIAFPDDLAKAKSIRGSTRVKRWKEAYSVDAVRNHPMEIAMRLTHEKSCINGRLAARNFGQSLSLNATLFKSSDMITKLKACKQLLVEQIQATKQREALADAGATSSRDKVLALSAQGKKSTDIAKLLDMSRDTVKSIIYRSKSR
ncbi:MAG: hypothetical protein CVU18_18760 [Betaproteobacteria bacterium HGW-Betaproteobacteria-12]|nr:MAG: hypothetical protein CVU18_18760 [Betaproteobacteria bacterium HGW-Betaproteobacteria-12]